MNDLVEVLRSKSAHDPALRALMKSIDSGKANFRDTAQYSIRYSHQLGNILSENVLDIPPDVRETAAEELLKYGYDDMNTILAEVQKSLDEQTGIHIRPQKADFPSERVQQFAHSLIDPTVEDSVIKRRARSGSETITKSFHDSFIKKNAQFRNDAGLKCYITREGSNCCKWCSEVAGRYEFGSQPSDIFRRHDNCDCTIDYDGQKLRGKLNADGSRSKTWEEVPDADGSYEPKVLSVTDARAAEQRNLSQFRGVKINSSSIDNGRGSGIIRESSKPNPITEITDKAIESVPKVNIYGYTDEQCAMIQKQHKELLEYSRKNNENKEVAFVFDSSLESRKEFMGSDDKIDFGRSLYGSDITVLHNHPRNSSYSVTDIIFFGDNSNVKTLTIVKNNGKVEYLTKSKEFDPSVFKLEYDRLYRKIVKTGTDSEKNKFVKNLLNKSKSGVIWSERT